MLKQIQWQMLELNSKHRKIFDKYAKYKYFEINKYKLDKLKNTRYIKIIYLFFKCQNFHEHSAIMLNETHK